MKHDALNRFPMVDAVGTTKYTYYAGGLLNTEDGPWSSEKGVGPKHSQGWW